MTPIELKPMGATLNEGAAVRIGRTADGADGETHVYFDPCEETKAVAISGISAEGTGRILDVSMTLKDVCPAKRVAVGVTVHEVDQAGNEYPRGFRAVTVPAHNHSGCCDVAVSSTRFILPEDIRVGSHGGVCDGSRHFVLRTTSHYIDSEVTL
ncbi:MAG: hypothetical protein PHI98_02070 [Eubacteriales bacterium]|nr:hypothetical protein [Eubacteriales bacterium]